MKPLISVVIPAYNEEKYLPSCLEALRKQTFKNFEIIVVDNNSKDQTAQIARKYKAKVVKEKRQGMVHSRERGFREASCELIARTDADTLVFPDWLEVIYKTFKKYPYIVGLTGSLLVPSKRKVAKLAENYSYIVSVTLGRLFSGHIYLTGPNMAVRKSAWEKVKVHKNDSEVHEDIDLSCHLAEVGKLLYVPQMKVTFSLRRINENPVKGLYDYLGEYPFRYFKTLAKHKRMP